MEMEKIKYALINIYKSYLRDPENEENHNFAAKCYNKYKGLDPILKPEIAIAINNLVDIGFNTGIKKSQDEIKDILKKLKNDIS